MPITDITNPAVIKFLTESYDKTARLRMKWNTLHADELKKSAQLHHGDKVYTENDVGKHVMTAGMLTITRDNKEAERNKRSTPIRDAAHIPGIADLKKGHSIADIGLGDVNEDPRLNRPNTDLQPDPLMRLMDPKIRKIIYKDIPVFGREAYLKRRYKIDPEKKFYFCQTGNWEYGWRLKDSSLKFTAPMYGSAYVLKRDLENRTGGKPDPDYYREPV